MRAVLLLVFVAACAGTSSLVGAAVSTSVAGGASLAQRGAGGCYAICTGGLVCNAATGFCDRPLCDAVCGRDEHCERVAGESRCAAGTVSDVIANAPGSQKNIPIVPPAALPNGRPEIIPAAEQKPPNDKDGLH